MRFHLGVCLQEHKNKALILLVYPEIVCNCLLKGMSAYKNVKIQSFIWSWKGICEGGHKYSCLLTRVSVKEASRSLY